MKRLISLALSLVLLLSLTGCGSGIDKDVAAKIAEYVDTYVCEDDYCEVDELELKAESLIVDGTEYAINGKEASLENDIVTFSTKEVDGWGYQVQLQMAGGAQYHELTLSAMSGGEWLYEVGNFVPSTELTTVELTSDNWSDYLKLERHIEVYNNSFDEPDDIIFGYALAPATEGVTVLEADIAVAFNYSEDLESEMTYNVEDGTYELTDTAFSKYSSEGEDDTSLEAYDFPHAYIHYAYADNFEYDEATNTVTCFAEYAGYVEITRLEGTITYIGTVIVEDAQDAKQTSDGWAEAYNTMVEEAKKAEEEAKKAEEESKAAEALANDSATYLDTDGNSVRAFKYGYTKGEYIAIHYDPVSKTIKYVDLFLVYDGTSNTVESISNDSDCTVSTFLGEDDAEDIFAPFTTKNVSLIDGNVFARFRVTFDTPEAIAAADEYIDYISDSLDSSTTNFCYSMYQTEMQAQLFYDASELVAK